MTVARIPIFKTKSAIKFAFNRLVAYWKYFIVIGVLFGTVSYLPAAVIETQQAGAELGIFVPLLIGITVPLQLLMSLGMMRISLLITDRKPAYVTDLVEPFMHFFDYAAATLLYVIITAFGFLLLIVPGIFWAVRFQLYGYVIADRGLGPIAALKESYRLTKPAFRDLIYFQIILGLISLLSLALLFIGSVIASLIYTLATAYVYRRIVYHGRNAS